MQFHEAREITPNIANCENTINVLFLCLDVGMIWYCFAEKKGKKSEEASVTWLLPGGGVMG